MPPLLQVVGQVLPGQGFSGVFFFLFSSQLLQYQGAWPLSKHAHCLIVCQHHKEQLEPLKSSDGGQSSTAETLNYRLLHFEASVHYSVPSWL